MAGERTTRQRIEQQLRIRARTAADLADAVGTTPAAVIDHVRHVARSIESTDSRVEVAPPRCRDCGFEGFDDPVNRPSRCPRCHGEAVADPTFRIRADDPSA